MTAYEFYWKDKTGNDHFIGILPERRKSLERITKESILNWGRMAVCEMGGIQKIYFIRIEVFEPPPLPRA